MGLRCYANPPSNSSGKAGTHFPRLLFQILVSMTASVANGMLSAMTRNLLVEVVFAMSDKSTA